jgi:hypothetical protein
LNSPNTNTLFVVWRYLAVATMVAAIRIPQKWIPSVEPLLDDPRQRESAANIIVSIGEEYIPMTVQTASVTPS